MLSTEWDSSSPSVKTLMLFSLYTNESSIVFKHASQSACIAF